MSHLHIIYSTLFAVLSVSPAYHTAEYLSIPRSLSILRSHICFVANHACTYDDLVKAYFLHILGPYSLIHPRLSSDADCCRSSEQVYWQFINIIFNFTKLCKFKFLLTSFYCHYFQKTVLFCLKTNQK